MTQPLTAGALRLTAGALVLFATISCSRSDKAQTDGAKSDSIKTVAATPASRGRAEPGALPKPIDQLTGDELFAFTRGLGFGGGHERRRRCRGRAACRGPRPKDSTLVRVDAVEREDSLSAGTLPANGVIGARAVNRGTMPDSVYNTRPGADHEYFLIVLSAPGGLATWRLEELTTTPGARSHHSVATGRFHPCDHPFQAGARADFKTCAQSAPTRQAAFGSVMQSDGESPIWIGCASGCCTADPPDGRG